jgi:hypothetical protein
LSFRLLSFELKQDPSARRVLVDHLCSQRVML